MLNFRCLMNVYLNEETVVGKDRKSSALLRALLCNFLLTIPSVTELVSRSFHWMISLFSELWRLTMVNDCLLNLKCINKTVMHRIWILYEVFWKRCDVIGCCGLEGFVKQDIFIAHVAIGNITSHWLDALICLSIISLNWFLWVWLGLSNRL